MKISSSIILLLILYSCDLSTEFDVPSLDITPPEIKGQILDIDAIIGLYKQNEEPYTFTDSELFLVGYVISDDAAGNFFKQLVIQDRTENPTAGIVIEIDVNSLFTKYPFGSKVFIKLQNLTIGMDNGVMKLGTANFNSIDRISSSKVDSIIIRTGIIDTIIAKPVNMTQFTDETENLYIELSDVQFNKFEVQTDMPKTFASEETDQFNGERLLESCTVNSSVVLSTSTFADFKSLRLPDGRGSIKGILSRDFFDEFYTVIINSPEDITFEQGVRCDIDSLPINSISCEPRESNFEVIFYEAFNGYSNLSAMEMNGWVNENLINDGIRYSLGSFDGNKYAQISGFNSGEYQIDSWLISPPIEVQSGQGRSLIFDIQSSYSNGRHLSVLISNNFYNSIEEAEWLLLSDLEYPIGPASGFGTNITTLPINITCIEGPEIRVAFRYQASDPIATTRYHIDNITVLQNTP